MIDERQKKERKGFKIANFLAICFGFVAVFRLFYLPTHFSFYFTIVLLLCIIWTRLELLWLKEEENPNYRVMKYRGKIK